MKLADILAIHPDAEIEVQATAGFYDGSIDYTLDRDTLTIPASQWPDAQGISRDYILEIDAVIRDFVNPEVLRNLDFEFDDDILLDHEAGTYYASIEGETRPDPKYGERLPLRFALHIHL